jgi:hypothetical protein
MDEAFDARKKVAAAYADGHGEKNPQRQETIQKGQSFGAFLLHVGALPVRS